MTELIDSSGGGVPRYRSAASARSLDRLRVVYIAGVARSGSTVLGCVLGGLPNTVFVGELVRFWRRFAEGELCSCGSALPDCHFWAAVTRTAFGQMTPDRARELDKLEQRVLRQRVIGLVPLRWSTRWSKKTGAMLEVRKRLYEAICKIADADCIIDSGKEVTFGAIMARLNDTRFVTIHLVRDPRGVAFSWQKHVHSDSEPGEMPRRPAAKTAARWISANLLVQFSLKRLSSAYWRVRYEDLVASPEEIALEISRASNLPASRTSVDGRLLRATAHHLVGSNPGVRSNLANDLQLLLDEEWRTRLSRGQQQLVMTLCGGLMAAYDYPLRRRSH